MLFVVVVVVVSFVCFVTCVSLLGTITQSSCVCHVAMKLYWLITWRFRNDTAMHVGLTLQLCTVGNDRQRDKVISTILRCNTTRVMKVLSFRRLTPDSLWEYSGQNIHVELQGPLDHTAGLGSWAGVIMEYALLCLTATGFFVQTFCFSGKEYRTWSSLHERQLFRGVVIYQIAVGSLLNHSPTLVLPTPLLCDVIPS